MAQTQPASSPQAVAIAAQSLSAISGGHNISDVTLTGSVTWNSSDSGTATLTALGSGESRVDLVLSDGTRSEVRDTQTGVPIGKWVNPNSTSGPYAFHNCQTDAAWFFPALGSIGSGPNVVLSYIGTDTRNGNSVQHIQTYLYSSTPLIDPATLQQLSTMDFYIDAVSFLPVAVTFVTHPDDDSATNLLVEVDFANYEYINGIAVPMSIKRYQQGNLLVDIAITTASFNSGLPLSLFSIA